MGGNTDALKSVVRSLGFSSPKKNTSDKEARKQRRLKEELQSSLTHNDERGNEHWNDGEASPQGYQTPQRGSTTQKPPRSSPHKGKHLARSTEEGSGHRGSSTKLETLSKARSKETEEAEMRSKKPPRRNSASPSLPMLQIDQRHFSEESSLRNQYLGLEHILGPFDVNHPTNSNTVNGGSQIPRPEISHLNKKEEAQFTISSQARGTEPGVVRKPLKPASSGTGDISQSMQGKQDTGPAEPISGESVNTMIDELLRDQGVTTIQSQNSGLDFPDEGETVSHAVPGLGREHSTIDVSEANHTLDLERTKDTDFKTKYTNLKKCYDDLMITMQDSIKKAAELATKNTEAMSELKGAIIVYKDQLEKFEERMQKLRDKHTSREKSIVEEHQLEIQRLDKISQQLNDDHAQETERLQQDRVKEQTKNKTEADRLFAEMKKKLEASLTEERQLHSATKIQHQESFGTIKNSYEYQLNESANRHGIEKRRLNEALAEKSKEIVKMLASRDREHQAIISQLKQEYNNMVQSKDNELRDSKNVHAGYMSAAAEDHRRQLQAAYANLDKVVDEHKKNTQAIRVAQSKVLEETKKQLQSEINSLSLQLQQSKDRKDEELRAKELQHGRDKNMIEQQYRQKIDSLQTEVDRLIQDKDLETKRLKEEHKVDKAEYVKALLLTNEDLKEALVTRDHFKVMSDSEVSRRYLDISIEIDDLARTPWHATKQRSWPFQPYDFQTSENDRRAKKEILGNTLWVVLYELIFCTPFRVFGTQGRLLEQEWIKKFASGQRNSETLYPQPPTKESETWRYEEIMRCVKAHSQPITQSDYKIRQDYETTLDECAEHIIYELETVTLIHSEEHQQIKELVKAMAELWLEIGQLRWRIFFSLSNSNRQPVRSRKDAIDRAGNLSLVVKPELRRMGNAQWERLDMEEVIVDCAGKFSVFHAA